MGKTWSRFRKHKLAWVGMFLLSIFIILAILAPFITPYGPLQSDYIAMYQPPSSKHWLGTDGLGRDILTRLLYGARVSLLLGFIIASLQGLIGVITGCISGVFGSKIDLLVQRIAEFQLSIPNIIGAMIIVSIIGPSAIGVVIGLTVFGWAPACRLIRGEILSLREEDFIDAARAIGISTFRLIIRHYLPNLIPIIIVFITVNVAFNILWIAVLSFLGFGIPPPGASWGSMLQDAQNLRVLENKPWIWLPPGIAISLTVISVNFIGDALRDALDPKYYKKAV